MSFEKALRTRLIESAPIDALIGKTSGAPSIDWTVSPQGAADPRIVLTTISDPRPQTHDGPDSIRPTRVQVDVIDADRATVVALREAAIATLMPAGTYSGIYFDRAFVDVVQDLGAQGETSFVHRDRIDFIIWHKG